MDQLRDSGINAVIDHAGERWKAGYERFAAEFFKSLKPGDQFSGEMLHQFVEANLDVQPHTPHAKGAMFRVFVTPLILAGNVVEAGFQKSVRASNHSRYCRVYRRVA